MPDDYFTCDVLDEIRDHAEDAAAEFATEEGGVRDALAAAYETLAAAVEGVHALKHVAVPDLPGKKSTRHLELVRDGEKKEDDK
jgi:hypothetical protein